jgi:hypothetical protein
MVAKERIIGLIGGICFGLTILIIGIILISTAGPNEVPLWFGATLCPTTNDPYYYISQDLPAAGACPAILYANQSQEQVFNIERSLFSPDGLEYHPIVFRNSDSAIVQFKLEDASNKLLFAEGPITISNNDVTTSALRADTLKEEEDNPAGMRKLMKGGRGSGSSSRGRSGSAGRYGTGSRVRSTSYGYNSCCVSSGVFIFVYRPGPLTRSGYYDTTDSDRSNCGDHKSGCQYELSSNMNRDEFSQISFVPDGKLKYPLKLTVAQASTNSPGLEPQLYFSFWTADPDNKKVASYVLIPLGCVIFVASIVLFFVTRSCFD